jgi:tRNA pseudouridine55 synthase
VSDGALLLDKPVGMTSNRALQVVKRIYRAKKAGHAGTLDPLASGLLIVLFGEATKFAGPLLDDDKEYRATLKLGEKTATGDAEGEVVERKEVAVDRAAVLAALQRFVGATEQVPPMYSALKRDGVPLYELARRGETVARSPRRVTISALELLAFASPSMEVRVRCSKGTYVRTLAEDIGAALGTVAHLSALRRTGSGGFRLEDAVALDALQGMPAEAQRARVLPLGRLLAGLPRADLDAAAVGRFRNGQTVPTSAAEGVCGVYGPDGSVLGLGRADGAGGLHPLRLMASAPSSQAAE